MDSNTRDAWQINKYLWMTLAGVGIYLPMAASQGLLSVPVGVAWLVFAIALANGAARSLIAFRRGGHLDVRLTWLFNLLDIGMVSLAIAITRGIESDLWLLYFVFMSFEAFYATSRQKRQLDCAVIIAYLLATLPQELRRAVPPIPPALFTRLLCTRLFFLILVSALGRRTFAQAQERNQQLSLLREQFATSEERARIAREVHDGLGHALVSVILRLELAVRLVRKNPEEAESLLKEEIPALRAAWNEGRDLAFSLQPWESEAGEEEDLPTILRRHIGRFAERTGLQVALKIEGEDWRVRRPVTFALTRIVQEALTNAARHAQAKAIEISLRPTERQQLYCRICDDGEGFVPELTARGVGMRTMRERVTALGGKFELTSAPGCGTQIEITLPQ